MNLNISAIMLIVVVVFPRIKSCFEKIWQDFLIQKGFIYYEGTNSVNPFLLHYKDNKKGLNRNDSNVKT